MSDDIRKIQDLLNLAEQELARNKLEARYILDITDLRKVLPKTGLDVTAKVRALGGVKLSNNEFMFEQSYAPEKLARQLLRIAREENKKAPQGGLFDRDFTSLGLAIARKGTSKKAFLMEAPNTGSKILNTSGIADPTTKDQLDIINKTITEENARIAASITRNLHTTTGAMGYLLDVKGGSLTSRDKLKDIKSKLEAKVTQYVEQEASRQVTEYMEQSAQNIFNNRPKPKARSSKKVAANSKTKQKITRIKPKLRVDDKGNIKVSGRFTSPLSLMAYLNALVHTYVRKHMGKGKELTYRSGTFARSVKIVSLTATREQAINIGYQYQYYPYETFEPGWKQGHKGYDPRRLITASMRSLLLQAMGITTAFIYKVK